ncbi:hypothetical protein C8Q75DRAFT_776542 [Abortiporus biennis]|nr:hypothetical protein C8Q75DRAFT_776542 [Abortiporus biennis]
MRRPFPGPKSALTASFCILWAVSQHGSISYQYDDETSVSTFASRHAFVELLKLLAGLAYFLFTRKGQHRPIVDPEPALPTSTIPKPFLVPKSLTSALLLVTSFLSAYSTYALFASSRLTDVFSVYFAISSSTLFILLSSLLLPLSTFHPFQWQAVLIQVSGFFVFQAVVIPKSLSPNIYPLLLALAFSTASSYIIIAYIYSRPHTFSFPLLNILFFLFTLLVHLIILSTQKPIHHVYNDHIKSQSPIDFAQCLVQAILDVLSLAVIYYHDATTLGVLISLATTVYLLSIALHSGIYTLGFLTGCALVIIGSVSFFWTTSPRNEENEKSHHHYLRRTGVISQLISLSILTAITIYLLIKTPYNLLFSPSPPRSQYQLSNLTGQIPPPLINKNDPLQLLLSSQETCSRKPLQSWSFKPEKNRTYHHFDDVLAIVFFSHARYDVNLDYWKETYQEFFPNVVFIGPGNREDVGFNHSYDVLVDTYESSETLVDQYSYKMAGRMAHHMLYTALLQNPCYKGYLWVPFDTFLNIPRLQLFDQSLVWYHSPFAEYVENKALGTSRSTSSGVVSGQGGISEEVKEGEDHGLGKLKEGMGRGGVEVTSSDLPQGHGDGNSTIEAEYQRKEKEKMWHPPAAKLSPDPTSVELTKNWRGWGIDWWWGSPTVGLSVCYPAYKSLSPTFQQNLARRTTINGTTRFIGGSSDTLYLPSKHYEGFLEVLGTFLETDCFLEIALPTSLHCVLEEDEKVLWVDHWWIWENPLNSTFVRNKWKESYEVDTFHTFHWGDRNGPDGIWKGNPENIKDVRKLLRESAKRQEIADWVW